MSSAWRASSTDAFLRRSQSDDSATERQKAPHLNRACPVIRGLPLWLSNSHSGLGVYLSSPTSRCRSGIARRGARRRSLVQPSICSVIESGHRCSGRRAQHRPSS
jgi:hypothetical protein